MSSSLRIAIVVTAIAAVLAVGVTAWADAKNFESELYVFLMLLISAVSGTTLGVFASRDD